MLLELPEKQVLRKIFLLFSSENFQVVSSLKKCCTPRMGMLVFLSCYITDGNLISFQIFVNKMFAVTVINKT